MDTIVILLDTFITDSQIQDIQGTFISYLGCLMFVSKKNKSRKQEVKNKIMQSKLGHLDGV